MTKTHLQSGTKLYVVWKGMHGRCRDLTNLVYGGRGITVDPIWNDYVTFKKWATENLYEEGLVLDRKNNDAGYSPENCQFVSRKINNNNKSNSIIYTCFGETKTLKQWAEDSRCLVAYKTLYKRSEIDHMPIELALTKPVMAQKRNRNFKNSGSPAVGLKPA